MKWIDRETFEYVPHDSGRTVGPGKQESRRLPHVVRVDNPAVSVLRVRRHDPQPLYQGRQHHVRSENTWISRREATSNAGSLQYKGLFTPSVSINPAMTLAIMFLLKTIKSLENGLQPHSGVTPLFSMRIESLTSLQSCCSIDADAWCKHALTEHNDAIL